MKDYTEDLKDDYRGLNERIRKLQQKLKATRNSLNKKEVVDELSDLEQQKLEMSNIFESEGEEPPQGERDETDRNDFPVLYSLYGRYSSLVEGTRDQVRDVQALTLYLRYYSDEFLGLFNERKLKLDVKYSVERDTFYGLFSQLQRKLDAYCEEARRIQSGDYSKLYETDILKRLIEMRNTLFLDADRFFQQLNRFSGDLLGDLEEEGILCQNGDDVLEYTELDNESVLPGLTVQEALGRLNTFSAEVIDYLDVPDFQR